MKDAADVWTHGVDGSVGAETRGVDPQVGGALFDHIPEDVDLHLGKQGEETSLVNASWSQNIYNIYIYTLFFLTGAKALKHELNQLDEKLTAASSEEGEGI